MCHILGRVSVTVMGIMSFLNQTRHAQGANEKEEGLSRLGGCQNQHKT